MYMQKLNLYNPVVMLHIPLFRAATVVVVVHCFLITKLYIYFSISIRLHTTLLLASTLPLINSTVPQILFAFCQHMFTTKRLLSQDLFHALLCVSIFVLLYAIWILPRLCCLP